MTIILAIAAGMLVIAAGLTITQLVRGPGPVDRVVSTDVLIAIVVCSLGIEAAFNRHSFTVPVMLIIALLGFAGTVSMARFVANRAELLQPSLSDWLDEGVEGYGDAEPDATDEDDELDDDSEPDERGEQS